MSFFDEDDEPLRTRTRARSAPPPRRGRAVSGGTSDSQTLLIRRMVAVIIGLVILVLLFFVVKACNDTRQKNALKEYNRQVSGIVTQSDQTGQGLFNLLNQGGEQPPRELYNGILGFRGEAEAALKQAQTISAPDEMKSAQQSLLIALELRRDGLDAIASKIQPALGDEGEAVDVAITDIAAQMQSFNASDVLYRTRVEKFIEGALKNAEVGGQTIKQSTFLPEISWLAPQFVAAKLDQQLASGSGENGDSDQPTGPGLHGTGLDATSYGEVTLQPGLSNRLTYVAGQPFTVSFTNQGDNDEFNVKVTLRIARESGSPLTINKTVPRIVKGEKATVTLPLNREPPLDTVVTISVTVGAVKGEKKTDNNKSSYPSLFVAG